MSGSAPLAVVAPQLLEDALATLADGQRWTPLAGGTELVPRHHAGRATGDRILSLHGLRPELRFVALFGERMKLGALATFRDVARATAVRERLPMLARAALHVGSPAFQHRATIGGALAIAANGVTLPVWSVLEATVELRSTAGFRRVPFARFLANGVVDRRPEELVTAIQAMIPPPRMRQYFGTVETGTKRASAAGLIEMERGVIKDVRFAVGTAASLVRATRTEELLRGRKLEPALVAEATATLTDELGIDDGTSLLTEFLSQALS